MSGDSLSLVSGTSGLTIRHGRNFCEGWVEHKQHTQSGVRYIRLWILLEDNIIYIFCENKPCSANQIGNLTIDSNSTFKYIGPAHDKNGYKFDLFAGKRLNRFKTRLRSELEQWRGYIVGLSRGTVPKDLDLLHDQVSRIEEDVLLFHTGGSRSGKYSPPSLGGDSGVIPDATSVSPSVFSGKLGPDGVSVKTGATRTLSGSQSGSGGPEGTSSMAGGGPTMVHRFYPDRFGDQTPPSWFVKRCSRETAENVLRNANRLGYGNTLMRESTSHINNGSYVISKLVRDKRTGDVPFEHYEVIRVAGGYKVHVENEHSPMICLDDVMRYFQQTCGGGTMPLKTNDFRTLQMDPSEPNYATKFPRRPVSMVTQETGRALAEPEPGAIYANEHLDWHDYDQPSFKPQEPFQTYRGPSRDNSETVQELDKAIEGGFQRNLDYVNMATEDLRAPKPHMTKSYSTGTTGYVNEEAETHHLPVAPPPPRHPIGSPTGSETKPLRSSKSFNAPPSSTDSNSTTMSTFQQCLAGVTLRKTKPIQQKQNEEPQSRSNVSKSVVSTSPRSTNSPSNFPQWNAQKKSPLTNNSAGSNSNITSPSDTSSGSGITATGSDTSASSDSGVDVRKLGGVGTLLRKFEVKPDASGTPKVAKKEKRVQFEQLHGSVDDNTSEGHSVFNKARERRQSEPAFITSDKLNHKFEDYQNVTCGRLSADFKNQLENLMKGATMPSMPKQRPSAQALSPSAPLSPPSGQPRSRNDMPLPPVPKDSRDDHVYEPLPDIPPDDVTYYNDTCR